MERKKIKYCIEGQYADGSLCVEAYEYNAEDGYYEPYAECSVCLAEYGFTPDPDQIVIPVYKTFGFEEQIIADLAEEVVGEITFGPFDAAGLVIRLRDTFLEKGVYEKGVQKKKGGER